MATKLWLLTSSPVPNLTIANVLDRRLAFTQGTGSGLGVNVATVAGPTGGVVVNNGSGSDYMWYSDPIAAVTISGTITMNLWMAESNMSANVGAQCIIDRVDASGTFISTVLDSERGAEVFVNTSTTTAVNNWTGTPTSTAFADGDLIRVRVAGNDIGTMASGFTFRLDWDQVTPGAEGDSWVQFTETITAFVAAATDDFAPYVGGGYYPFIRSLWGGWKKDRRVLVPTM
jgi:hypothetical protein